MLPVEFSFKMSNSGLRRLPFLGGVGGCSLGVSKLGVLTWPCEPTLCLWAEEVLSDRLEGRLSQERRGKNIVCQSWF